MPQYIKIWKWKPCFLWKSYLINYFSNHSFPINTTLEQTKHVNLLLKNSKLVKLVVLLNYVTREQPKRIQCLVVGHCPLQHLAKMCLFPKRYHYRTYLGKTSQKVPFFEDSTHCHDILDYTLVTIHILNSLCHWFDHNLWYIWVKSSPHISLLVCKVLQKS